MCGFQITLIATHVPRYVQDKGLADWTGMAILALIGFFNIIGTFVMGYLGDKYSKKNSPKWIIFFERYNINTFYILTCLKFISGAVWNFFWFALACNGPGDKWNCSSNIWNKKFDTLVWNCFLEPSVWIFFRSLFRWVFL